MFLVALDRTIVATAIPRITDDFHSLGDIGWYGSAYMLTTAASQLVFGRLYKHYNMKWVFLIAIAIFEAGSAICGAAPTSPVFIFGRAVAGLGSAGIFSGAMMIMIPMIPLHKRPMFQSMFGMVFGISSVLGPLVGGGFTNGVTWRWCFYINLPIGGFAFVFMLFFWNPPPRKVEPAPFFTHIKRLDPLGAFFFVPSIVCLLLALQWGGSTYAWNSWRIILLFVLFGVLAFAFAIVQVLTPETASIPVRIITQRSVICATLFTFFIAGSMLILVYYLPVWFQTVKLINPLKSGIYTLPLVLSLVASSMLGGIFTQRIGYYIPAMLFCPMVMAVGEGLLSTLTRSSLQASWVGFQFLSGFGLGFGMQTGGLVVQTVLPMSDVPMGIALIFFVQQLGGAVATSMGQTILSNLLVSRLAGIPGIDPEQIVNNGATELTAIVPAQDIDTVISVYDYALTRIFLTAMGMALAALLAAAGVEWRSIKEGKPGHSGPGAGAPPPTPSRA
ncbi:major facilitator superfamily MFS-1, partial [Cryphonectria parasitica EP155]